jgi:hypothetical protein
MKSREEIKASLQSWVQRKARGAPAPTVLATTPLLASGIITSLHLAELIAMLEMWRGEPIDVQALAPGDFQDIQTIMRRFFSEAQGTA